MIDDSFKLGEHQARLDTMAADIATMKTDVKTILTRLDRRDGERAVLDWSGRFLSALIGALAALGVKKFIV